MKTSRAIAIKCIREEAEAILNLENLLSDDFEKAVELIYNCKGKLVVIGVGKSGHIGAKISATLSSTGTPSFFMNPLDAYHGDLGAISSTDIVLAISYSGRTDELLRLIPSLKKIGVPIIAMTSDPSSLLAQYAYCHLSIKVEKEACPINLAPTSSTVVTLALGDALACALEVKRNFSSDEFALFHPGGSLGRKLLTKVSDYMYTEDLPTATPEDLIYQIIFKISKSKLGIVAVLNEDGTLIGVMTDGDVRRALEKNKDLFFSSKVGDYMNSHPKYIHAEESIIVAEELLKNSRIHSLPVVDENNKLVGIIDSFKCM